MGERNKGEKEEGVGRKEQKEIGNKILIFDSEGM